MDKTRVITYLHPFIFSHHLHFKTTHKNNIIFLIIVFFEGIFRSVVDLITLRNTYVYSKNYTRLNYIIFTEGINNIGRVIILTLFYITNISLEK